MADEDQELEIRMDGQNLYREEIFTDRRVGTIQRLTPVDGDGQVDTAREVVFVGQTQLLTRAGPLPLSFDIPGTTLKEAADNFAASANVAVEDAMQKLEEMRREAASSIIVPQGGAPGGGMPGGGVPGGGKIRMP
ncbi:MAG: hypothetical protein JSV45_15975 [Chromatiales bacterium]|nr:MAG: hypothetical protein JSV45_15975 [Chromatiales bacterium]